MATTHWWVGGGSSTNWNAVAPTNWSIIGSGGPGGAAIPLAGDDVIFDNGSGTGASVWNTTISLNSLTCNASRNLVTHNAAITITISGGNLSLPGGVGGTYTANALTSQFIITGTSGTQQITSNGKNFSQLTLNGVAGTFQLQDNFTCTANAGTSIVTLTNGTFDCQTFTVNTAKFASNNANTRVLKGSGAWTLSGNVAATIWDVTATLTVTNFTSAITIAATTASQRTFSGAGLSYGAFSIGANTSGGLLIITGANTFSSFSVTAPVNVQFPTAGTNIITAAFTWNGSASNQNAFSSNNTATAATISTASGTPTITWAALESMAFTGGATFTASNSFDLKNNSGITITAPSGGPVGQQTM